MLADVSVSVGRAAEHTDRTAMCGVPLATTAALQDLGFLVLGNHALDLSQEILRGTLSQGIAEEDDLDAVMREFLEHQNLISIFA